MKISELSRLYKIIRVFLHYGLDELIPALNITKPIKFARKLLFWLRNQHPQKPLGERLRLALQELGPVWIKFGQMMSTRRDLFPDNIADQLALLQDQVKPFDGQLARQQIEQALGGTIEQWFDDFNITPLASASIAQVHTARLKENNQEIIIKVIRPDILPVIKADIRLMYRLADWLPVLLPDGRRLRAKEVVREYERTLLDELDLLRESANTIQLRRNFMHSPLLYIPQIYSNYCRKNMLVMERIYGIPVSDIAALKANGTDLKLLAERGVQTFFTQVFRDSFFHADMHPGNIFINKEHPEDPQYIGIDCGIVGILSKEDKRYLAENFLAFFNRDYRKIAELYVSSGWIPADTNVSEFEAAVRTVCEPIFAKPLSEISFGHLLVNLFNTARHFNMEVQPQLVLLEKTLLYIEGLGRQLYPQLDLWTTAKPFLETWLREQMGVKAMLRSIKEKAPYWNEKIPELPDLIYENLQQNKSLPLQLQKFAQELQQQNTLRHRSLYLLGVGAALLISSSILFIQGVTGTAISLAIISLGIWIVGWKRVR